MTRPSAVVSVLATITQLPRFCSAITGKALPSAVRSSHLRFFSIFALRPASRINRSTDPIVSASSAEASVSGRI